MNKLEPVEIMLVDDDVGDVRLTMESLATNKMTNPVVVAQHGRDALDLLQDRCAKGDRLPGLILLDINMPVMDGFEFLKRIKADAQLRSIPVVVLTTSTTDEDVLKSYDLQASCFISKPVNAASFLKVVQELDHFWFSVVRIPRTRPT